MLPELAQCAVDIGFAENENINNYPNADVISNLMDSGVDAFDMWRAVLARWVARLSRQEIPTRKWDETVKFLKRNPEDVSLLMQSAASIGQSLIVFDALDRTSGDWKKMDLIVRGLIRAVLWLKPYANLSAKVFLRDDQAERSVFNFPDASKLLATKEELTWSCHDLHGMLWQRLINSDGPHGKALRELCACEKSGSVWRLSDVMKRETKEQREAFAKLAGPWMGKDRRRGIPYVWSVSHLADARGYTSPRSFSAAIFQAAQDSRDRYPTHEYALHYESIKRGIQKASEIRVNEIAEDYPWIRPTLEALQGLIVPCAMEDVLDRWEERFPQGPKEAFTKNRLPAQHAVRGWAGILDDLARLGLVERMQDERFNMPDLYRVGFGLGRRGGVAPKRNETHG
jgi:hypothetical protein